MSTQVCGGTCGKKFKIPEDIDNGTFFSTGICGVCYQKWADDPAMCFGKAVASKDKSNCQKCSEFAVCLEWNEKLKQGVKEMAKKAAAKTQEPVADPAAQPEPTAPAKQKKAAKAVAAPAAQATAKAPAAAKAAAPAKAEKKMPYRTGSGLAIAFEFLMGGYRTLEEVVKHVGGKWKNPDFLKNTSLLKPGPDKPWTTEEKGGKYKIIMK